MEIKFIFTSKDSQHAEEIFFDMQHFRLIMRIKKWSGRKEEIKMRPSQLFGPKGYPGLWKLRTRLVKSPTRIPSLSDGRALAGNNIMRERFLERI
jgi:hypothetical protein